jgi:hypothetical protein
LRSAASGEQIAAPAADCALAHTSHLAELFEIGRRLIGHCQQRLVTEDLERRDIEGTRLPIAPLVKGEEPVSRFTAKAPAALDALENERIGITSRVTDAFELSKVLRSPLPSTERFETGFETVDKITEIGGVSCRVRKLAVIQRATSPIRPLVLLVEEDPEFFFEQGGEAGFLLAEQLRHDLGVLETRNPNAIISIEDPDVVVRAVHQQRHSWIAHDIPQRPQIAGFDGQRIDHHVMSVGTDLDQTYLVEVGMHRVGLGVEGDPARGSAPVGGLTHTFGGIDPEGVQNLGHGWGW